MKRIKQSPIVDFVIIGAMKAGSTTLVDYLQQNVQLCFAKPKEPQYFSRYYDDWSVDSYESLWKFPDKICGEASTCYSRWPHYQNVPERLYKYNPDIKLIYILRNPIDRAYSHYRHNVLVDRINYSSFDEAIEKSDEIIMTSCYMAQIKQFLAFFPKEQLLLVNFDDLIHDDIDTINAIESFLGVNLSAKSDFTSVHSNEAGVGVTRANIRKKIDMMRNLPLMKQFVDICFSQDTRRNMRKLIYNKITDSSLVTKMATKKALKFDSLKVEHCEKISRDLERELVELEVFWGRDLSKWKTSKRIS